ncbi:hypothetical protein FRC00_011519 [Tulasnella sp. 408]|nr:hypothetical protein FRC00_011519 [Tulasnella sp. 408]
MLIGSGWTDPNNGNQRVFICADHPHELKNSKNTSVRGANKSDIAKLTHGSRQLACLVEAVSIGGPVVIYYSGHGGRKAATLNNGLEEYNEDATKAHKAKEGGVKDAELAYIVSGDCQEIWGKVRPLQRDLAHTYITSSQEVGAALLKGLGRNGGRKTTIFVSSAIPAKAKFLKNSMELFIAIIRHPFFAFPCVYRAEDLGGVTEELVGETKFGQNQIIFLASTQLDQEAHTLLKGERMQDHGAVTWFTTWFLPALEPGKKAKDLVNRLCGMCHSKGQTPQIRSLRPIVDLEIELLHG